MRLGWYQILIVVIAAVGLAVMIVNFLITGRDVPSGILTLLGSIFGIAFGTDTMLQWRRNAGFPPPNPYPSPSESPSGVADPMQTHEVPLPPEDDLPGGGS